jgi:hypothetical protein
MNFRFGRQILIAAGTFSAELVLLAYIFQAKLGCNNLDWKNEKRRIVQTTLASHCSSYKTKEAANSFRRALEITPYFHRVYASIDHSFVNNQKHSVITR